jgi:hypothetical protein
MEDILENGIGQRLSDELHTIQRIYPDLFRNVIHSYGLPRAHLLPVVPIGENIVCSPLIDITYVDTYKEVSHFRIVLLFSDITVKVDSRTIELSRGDMFICKHLPEIYSREDTFGLLEIYVILSGIYDMSLFELPLNQMI